MTKQDLTLEEHQELLPAAESAAVDLRGKATELETELTHEPDPAKAAEIQVELDGAKIAADTAEQTLAELRVDIEKLQDPSGETEDKEVLSTNKPKVGMPCVYRMMCNGPRIANCSAIVKKVHTKPAGSSKAGVVDLEVLIPGKEPQLRERIKRGATGHEADTWSPTG